MRNPPADWPTEPFKITDFLVSGQLLFSLNTCQAKDIYAEEVEGIDKAAYIAECTSRLTSASTPFIQFLKTTPDFNTTLRFVPFAEDQLIFSGQDDPELLLTSLQKALVAQGNFLPDKWEALKTEVLAAAGVEPPLKELPPRLTTHTGFFLDRASLANLSVACGRKNPFVLLTPCWRALFTQAYGAPLPPARPAYHSLKELTAQQAMEPTHYRPLYAIAIGDTSRFPVPFDATVINAIVLRDSRPLLISHGKSNHVFTQRIVPWFQNRNLLFPYTLNELAAYFGGTEYLRLQLDDYPETDKEALLPFAVNGNQPNCLRVLLDAKASVNAVDRFQATPLHAAARWGSAETVRVLLGAKANVNAVTRCSQETPLHLAAWQASVETVRALLDAKASVNTNSAYGTPLHIAWKEGNVEAMSALLEATTDTTVLTKDLPEKVNSFLQLRR